MTVATGELSDLDADRTGLVPTHAYAVLDVRKVNVSSFNRILINVFEQSKQPFVFKPTFAGREIIATQESLVAPTVEGELL